MKWIIELSKTKYYDIEVEIPLDAVEPSNLEAITEALTEALYHETSLELDDGQFNLSLDPEDYYTGSCEVEWLGVEKA